MTRGRTDWTERSRAALVVALDDLRARLEAPEAASTRPAPPIPEDSALARVLRKFRPSPFERDLLLLAAGAEVDSRVARLVSDRHRDPGRSRPTCSLALSMLAGAHWSGLSPDGVLRRARLIRLGEAAGLVDAPIAIEEPVLHALHGLITLDERLRPFVMPLSGHPLVASQERAAARIAQLWSPSGTTRVRAKVLLTTADVSAAADVCAAACALVGLTPFEVDLAALPADRTQIEDLAALWERDAVLHDFALLVDATAADVPERRAVLSGLLERLTGFVVVVGDRAPARARAAMVHVPLEMTTPAEQAEVWRQELGPLAATLNGHLERVTEQSHLPASVIVDVATELRAMPAAAEETTALPQQVWEMCRRQARGGLDDVAQRIEPRASRAPLILPEAQTELLRSIAMHVRRRSEVYEGWGFRDRATRGLGVSALFHGPSGVGKTFAAESLAGDLGLDLYRIDLSAAVSKYIGETEKNLRRIFDAAEQSGAILLFDEADALFGRRSEVSDSHDRYANIEVSYLLQRMEQYRGLAILTTNLKSALDPAFLRRLRFVVPFPFPSAADRARIWNGAFPTGVPVDPGVDYAKLARLAVSGGNISNIALDAAFRAADESTAVSMRHLLAAARAECAKLEKPISDAETRGWT
jgi:hypothetical protein